MRELVTHSAHETRRLGERLAAQLAGGDVLLLRGGLGAGKSELARGVARGLGITGPVTSPSFTILQLYTGGRLTLYHFDWYRLHGAEELYELSMDEYLYGEGVCLVEWPDMAPEALPERRLSIQIDMEGGDTRRITVVPEGGFRTPDWRALEVSL